jgi:hypothetical protein
MDQTGQSFSQRRIETVNELPIERSNSINLDKDRRITDICCCGIGVIFGLTLFILALVLLNKNNLVNSNFPTDNQGNLCLKNPNPAGAILPFIYFNDTANPLQSRVCVSDCPQPGVNPQCWNGPCNLNYYPTNPQSDSLGSYCMPEDSTTYQNIRSQTNINFESDAITAIWILLISFGIAIGLGIIWMVLVHYCPKVMVWVAFILAILMLIGTAVLFFMNIGYQLSQAKGWAIFLGVVAVIMALIIALYIIMHRNRIHYCAVFLDNACKMIR